MSKNLIYINDFSKEEINEIFRITDNFTEGAGQKKILEWKTVVLFFPESSIRTRVTFEKGIADLGGKTVLFPPSALDKKEKIQDVMGYLENWVDAVVVRHSDIEVVKSMAECAKIPVVNAMTSENHPCEIITDLYSLSKLYKDIETKKFFQVFAYKMVDGEKVKLAGTVYAHVSGAESEKYTNPKALALNKNRYSIKAGKTANIKAKVTLTDKTKELLEEGHAAKFRYRSSDKSVATVDKNGKIKGIEKGTCTIYVYAVNGLMKKVKVTVK